jgi:methionine aminopeptidase
VHIHNNLCFGVYLSLNMVPLFVLPCVSDLGAHIDGFVAVTAHTLLVQAAAGPVTGPAADVMQAAHTAAEVAMRLIKPGKKVSGVAEQLEKVMEAYGCSLVEGVLTHQMKQFVIDGNKVVLNKVTPEMKVEEDEFEENEVYAVDIVVSTGEGKARVLDEKETSVFKRALDMEYNLKMKVRRVVGLSHLHAYTRVGFHAEMENDDSIVRLCVYVCVIS